MKLSSVSRGHLAGKQVIPRSNTHYCTPGFAVKKGVLVRQVKSVETLEERRLSAPESALPASTALGSHTAPVGRNQEIGAAAPRGPVAPALGTSTVFSTPPTQETGRPTRVGRDPSGKCGQTSLPRVLLPPGDTLSGSFQSLLEHCVAPPSHASID